MTRPSALETILWATTTTSSSSKLTSWHEHASQIKAPTESSFLTSPMASIPITSSRFISLRSCGLSELLCPLEFHAATDASRRLQRQKIRSAQDPSVHRYPTQYAHFQRIEAATLELKPGSYGR